MGGATPARVAAGLELLPVPPTTDANCAVVVKEPGYFTLARRAWNSRRLECNMKVLLTLLIWCLLLALCWPLALAAVILFPVVWLLALPFRVIGLTVEALLALLKAILFLPARLLGYRNGN
jgi:hypothetical protein